MLTALCMTAGCTRTIYTTLENSRTDSVSVRSDSLSEHFQTLLSKLEAKSTRRDSIVIRDSVVMIVSEQGEVLSRERYRDTGRSTSTDQTLSLIQARLDSINTARSSEMEALINELRATPVPVERPLSKWQKLKQDIGGMAIGILVAAVAAVILWLIRRFRRRVS